MPTRSLPWLALAAWLVLMVLLQPINHDEDQYVAAAVLAGRGLVPFRDFMYLQTPLQPWLLGPVAAATPGWTVLALRLANAGFGLTAIGLVHATLRRHGVAARTALWSGALLALSLPFAYGARVARNDALPTALMALALWALAGPAASPGTPAAPSRARLVIAGLALGLATSAKISLAPPLAAAGLWLAARAVAGRSPARFGDMIAYGGAGIVGLIPVLAAWLAAPAAFQYGVLGFATVATPAWYSGNSLEDRLTLGSKLVDSAAALAQGPALLALLLVGMAVARRRQFGLADALCVGALAGALLPSPTWPQYFMPMLPPLFMILGRDAETLPRWAGPALSLVAGATAIALLAVGGAAWQRAGAPAALAARTDARWIGAQVRGPGAIASLSVARIADSGRRFDARFAGGASFYRTAGDIGAAELSGWQMTGPHTLAADLDRLPPAALLTGYEGADGVNRRQFPDAAIEAWARSRGYRPTTTPDGRGKLWLPEPNAAKRPADAFKRPADAFKRPADAFNRPADGGG